MTWKESRSDRAAVRLILDRWWVVVALALIGAISGYWLSLLNPTVYESSAKFVIATDSTIEDPSDVAAALGVLRNRQVAATYAEILQSQTLLDRAVREIGGDTADFESVSTVLPESNVVSLTIAGPEAEQVQDVNELVSAAAGEDLANLYPIYQALPLESAKTPESPASPVPVRDAIFGAAIGAFIGIVLAVVWPVGDGGQSSPLVGIETVQIHKRAEAGGES